MYYQTKKLSDYDTSAILKLQENIRDSAPINTIYPTLSDSDLKSYAKYGLMIGVYDSGKLVGVGIFDLIKKGHTPFKKEIESIHLAYEMVRSTHRRCFLQKDMIKGARQTISKIDYDKQRNHIHHTVSKQIRHGYATRPAS